MSTFAPPACVADTHILIWLLTDTTKLSTAALAAIRAAEAVAQPVFISAITFVELRYLVEKGVITAHDYGDALQLMNDPASVLTVMSLSLVTADMTTQIPRATVPDMPDRIIAATALQLGLPLITADHKIRQLTNPSTIW